MAIIHTTNEYLIARGRVYFDPFDVSGNRTGEIPLGNCPGLNISISTDKWEHYSSEGGLQEKDGGGAIRVNRTGKLTCDNFSPGNAALWLSGSNIVKTQSTTPVVDEPITVLAGRQYQLGAGASNPLGVRAVGTVSAKLAGGGGATLVLGTDYNLDAATGRIQMIAGTNIPAGTATNILVSYTPAAGTFDSVASGASAELQGALRVVSDNATGKDRDWYLPKVSLVPGGDLALIAEGTDVVAMEFDLEVLVSGNLAAIYCDGRPVA